MREIADNLCSDTVTLCESTAPLSWQTVVRRQFNHYCLLHRRLRTRMGDTTLSGSYRCLIILHFKRYFKCFQHLHFSPYSGGMNITGWRCGLFTLSLVIELPVQGATVTIEKSQDRVCNTCTRSAGQSQKPSPGGGAGELKVRQRYRVRWIWVKSRTPSQSYLSQSSLSSLSLSLSPMSIPIIHVNKRWENLLRDHETKMPQNFITFLSFPAIAMRRLLLIANLAYFY